MDDTVMNTSPQGVANRLHYRLSERYPLGAVEVSPTAGGDEIVVTLHARGEEVDKQTFSYAELKAAADPLNVALPRLKAAEDLVPVNKDTKRMDLAGKVIEVAKRARDEDDNVVEPVVLTGDKPLFGADSAPDGAVTEGISQSANPGEAVEATPKADTDTTKDVTILDADDDDKAEGSGATRSRTRAATTKADGSNADSAAVANDSKK